MENKLLEENFGYFAVIIERSFYNNHDFQSITLFVLLKNVRNYPKTNIKRTINSKVVALGFTTFLCSFKVFKASVHGKYASL